MGNKKRANHGRINTGQYDLFLTHQSRHKELRSTGDPKLVKQLWLNLANELNSFGSGATKPIVEWKETFAMWQCRTRLKARNIHTDATSGKRLTELEERALSVWGKAVITNVGVGCVGIDNDSEEEVDRWFEQSKDERNPKTMWGHIKKEKYQTTANAEMMKARVESTHWPEVESDDEERPTMASDDNWREEPADKDQTCPSNHSIQTHLDQMESERDYSAVPSVATAHKLPDTSDDDNDVDDERVPQSKEKMEIECNDSNDQHYEADDDYYEDQMFRAIGRLTERIGDVAEQIASGNELLKSVLANQDKIIARLLE